MPLRPCSRDLIPVLQSTRNQKYPTNGIYDIAGIGDMVIGAQAWVLRPPDENGGNIAFSAGLKLPTGLSNGMGTGTLNGVTKKYVADQSIQPGDGTWGLTLGTQAVSRRTSTPPPTSRARGSQSGGHQQSSYLPFSAW